MKELLSPKQVAASIGVSESSMKRWCDQGMIVTERTPGGHRRIRRGEVIRFLRERQHPIVRPELLGLPVGTGLGPRNISKAGDALLEALERGDNEQSRRLVIDLFLAGNSVVRICDELITPCLHAVGDRWEDGRVEIYQEHQACEIINRTLYDLRGILPPADGSAPIAIGGTPPGDNYRLATLMVELVLADAGWRAVSLGSSLPFATMAAAVSQHQPDLFWLSFSHIPDEVAARRELQGFLDATPDRMKVAIGGQRVDGVLDTLIDGDRVHACANLQSLKTTIGRFRRNV